MAKNNNLHAAKTAKNDEFYTQYTDIQKELCNYPKSAFEGKVVYCNCDDARESQFFRYFSNNFELLGLKRLITTSYNPEGKGSVLVYDGDRNGNKQVDDNEIIIKQLEGNGDFRSEECIGFLKQADIVVTNPPFSLFREYVKQLMDFGKKFIIIGNGNAITYKEIFPYIKDNKMWVGCKSFSGGMNMYPGSNYDAKKCKHPIYDQYGRLLINVMMCIWFTNVEHSRRNKPLDLVLTYTPDYYPKYDNYDAIEVSKVSEIPCDYDGVMGVPITFLDKYCPSQFEIVDARLYGKTEKQRGKGTMLIKDADSAINGKATYARIAIKRLSCG